MPVDRFASCLAEVLAFEGGYADDPADRGGPTNLGVTLAVLSQWLGRPAGANELRSLTPAAAAAIYRALYWRPAGCEGLPAGVDLMVFDGAVNMGVAVAVRMLQAAVGAKADGVAGQGTLAAAARAPAEAVIAKVGAARRARYLSLEGFDVFGSGWLRRLDVVTAKALAEVGATSDTRGAIS